MADDVDKQDDVAGEAPETGPIAGERLAEARREQQIPVLEIAKELHLDEQKVRALESNDFDVIGAAVFAKGHLRKYAQLVGVDEADVMADYYQLTRASDSVPLISVLRKPRREFSPGPWIVVLLIVAIAAAGYWWFVEREPAPAAVSDEITPLPTPAETSQQQVELPAATEALDVSEPVEQDDVVEVQQDSPAVVEATEMQISVTYSGDCWTEITDAQGRRLFFGLGTAGRTVNLSGEPPFNVLFGNADNVSIAVNSEAYEISPSDRRGRTARMTITDS